MSFSGILKQIKKRGVKLTLAKIPVGRRPVTMEKQIHEAFERELLIKLLGKLHTWFDLHRAQGFEGVDRLEVEQLVDEICAREEMLRKYRS